jgi:two-component system nitrate/nitrite response regulator NarL
MIKVLLVDDHSIVLDALRTLLGTEDNIEVVGTATNAEEALVELNRLDINVIVSDIIMDEDREMNGIDLLETMRSKQIKTPVIFLSMDNKPSTIKRAILSGASGFITKGGAVGGELISAIKEVNKNGSYLDRASISTVFQIIKSMDSKFSDEKLTERQRTILELVEKGKNSKEIGEILNLSSNTVESHKRNMVTKLGLNGMKELYLKAADLLIDF